MAGLIRKGPILQASGISFENINFRYFQEDRRSVFENFSMQIKKDKITVLTGPSGCGKSTLLYLAAGLYPEHSGILTGGKVLVDGKKIQEMDALTRSQSVRLVFQNADLQFCFPSVEREIIFSMEAADIPVEEMPDLLAEVLQAVRLQGFEKRLISTLSGGEKQRLSLACQLVSKAPWLLLDEIFAQVDDEQIKSIVRILVELKNKYQLSYLVVDHHLENWQGIADEYFLLDREGRLVAGPEQTASFTGQDWNAAGVINSEKLYPVRGELFARQAGDTKDSDGALYSEDYSQGQSPNVLQGKANAIGQPFLSVRDLSVSYADRMIFEHLSFDLEKGKIYALMGPSGIGKTSLLKALGGFIPHRGDILYRAQAKQDDQVSRCPGQAGQRVFLKKFKKCFKKQAKLPYTMRYIFQNPQDQFLQETVAEEILLSLKDLYGGDKEKQKTQAIKLLKDNGLWSMRRQAPFQLSEGQQRRLAVITLLSEQAELILCDEPTYAQDYNNTLAIMDLLVAAARDRKATIVFTTHDKNLAKHYADHILFLGESLDDKARGRRALCII